MNTIDYRIKYQDNIEVLKKLKAMLNTSENFSNDDIIGSIKIVEKEQEDLIKIMRKNINNRFSKKAASLFKEREIVLDEEENLVYDISDVKISEVKEETPLKVINITGEEDKKNNDITEVLKKDKVTEKQLESARIVFDGSYKLIYNNGASIYKQKFNDVLLDLSLDDPSISHNFNITNLLKNFDYENDTHINDLYMTDKLPVFYDFSKLEKSYDKKIKKKTKKIAKREKKYNPNVRLFDDKFKKVKNKLALAATIGIVALGGIFGSLNKNRSNEEDRIISNNVVSNAGETDASYNEIKIEPVSVIEKLPELDIEKEDSVQTTNYTNNEKVEESKEEIIKTDETYKLDSVDLYTASTDKIPSGNTSYSKETNSVFKINLISVVYNNQVVMKLVNNNSIDIDALESVCKDKYGENFKIFVNPNELDEDGNLVTENVGWIPEAEFVSKGKVLKR